MDKSRKTQTKATRRAKSIRVWNGRGFDCRGDALYVAAYSRREAARMIAESEKRFRKIDYNVSNLEIGRWDRELHTYFSDCWGNAMNGITPEKGVWYTERFDSKPKRIWP